MRQVTDAEFETAYKNQDNRNIIEAVTKKYSNKLSKDTQKTCGMYGLWRCIQNHDNKYGRKFTTSLFIHVDWECKRELSSMRKKSLPSLGDQDENIPSPSSSGDLSEMIESLPENQKDIIKQRFCENRTLEEIGNNQGYSKEAARQNINKILSKLRDSCPKDFGV